MQQVIFKAGKKERNGMSESLIPPSSSSREASSHQTTASTVAIPVRYNILQCFTSSNLLS
ncbi:hypothetical protein NC653_041869 [Populus alba x Populus x berolinensis]|uniref:Uncharacterized protein n=1 Tax=Populus alba x Populus x berolinensis TaxID=444605 RepID=A0AAD6PPK6_9ROSI|nr:hypothetical protein NC653_041869 [Populus alba x Populus x berolinensis]